MVAPNVRQVISIEVQGTADLRQMQTELSKFNAQIKSVRTDSFGNSLRQGAVAGKQLQSAIGNAGLQIGDFAVQVEGGVSATRALTQQLPQLLGAFGVWGAALSGAVAVAIPLWRVLRDDAMADLASSTKQAAASLENISSALDEAERAAVVFNENMNESGRLLKQFAEDARELSRLNLKQTLKTQAEAVDTLAREARKAGRDLESLNELMNAARAANTPASDLEVLGDEIERVGNEFGIAGNKVAEYVKRAEAIDDALDAGDIRLAASLLSELSEYVAKYATNLDVAAERSEKLQDSAHELGNAADELDRLNGTVDQTGMSFDEAAAAAEELKSTLDQLARTNTSLAFDNAALEAQNRSLKEGNDLLQARVDGEIARKLLELSEAMNSVDPEIRARANAEWQTWNELLAENTRLQRENQAILDARTAATRDAAAADREAARAAQENARAIEKLLQDSAAYRDQTIKTAEQNIVAMLNPVEAAVERLQTIMDEMDAALDLGVIFSPDQIAVYKRGVAEMEDEIERLRGSLSEVGEIIQDSFTGLFDDLISGTKSASEAFNDMLVSMLNSISSFLFQQQVQNFLGLLSQQSGFGWMNVNQGTVGVTRSANIARAPVNTSLMRFDSPADQIGMGSHMSLVQPARPIMPATAQARSAQQSATTVNVYGAPAGTEVEETISPSGEKQIDVYIRSAVQGMVGDGSLDRQMRTSYGLRRRAG